MKFDDIVLDYDPSVNGVYGSVGFGPYELTIIKHEGSYGGKQGLYEIGVWRYGDAQYLPGVTSEGDSVRGWLTEEDVTGILRKMECITGEQGKEIRDDYI